VATIKPAHLLSVVASETPRSIIPKTSTQHTTVVSLSSRSAKTPSPAPPYLTQPSVCHTKTPFSDSLPSKTQPCLNGANLESEFGQNIVIFPCRRTGAATTSGTPPSVRATAGTQRVERRCRSSSVKRSRVAPATLSRPPVLSDWRATLFGVQIAPLDREGDEGESELPAAARRDSPAQWLFLQFHQPPIAVSIAAPLAEVSRSSTLPIDDQAAGRPKKGPVLPPYPLSLSRPAAELSLERQQNDKWSVYSRSLG
jgi:hypothetical protein